MRRNSRVAIPYWNYLSGYGIPKPELEYRFHPDRKWRFDMAWPVIQVAIEVQGSVWTGGKHGRGSGIVKDYEKLNFAQLLGWRVFQFTPEQVYTGYAASFLLPLLMGVRDGKTDLEGPKETPEEFVRGAG